MSQIAIWQGSLYYRVITRDGEVMVNDINSDTKTYDNSADKKDTLNASADSKDTEDGDDSLAHLVFAEQG